MGICVPLSWSNRTGSSALLCSAGGVERGGATGQEVFLLLLLEGWVGLVEGMSVSMAFIDSQPLMIHLIYCAMCQPTSDRQLLFFFLFAAMVVLVLLCFALTLVLGFLMVCAAVLRWHEARYRKKGLPPGTMGWPLFGETTEFINQGPSFMWNRKARYGNLFRSHILGCPTVVSMDAEVNRYILMSEGKGLVPGYPQSMLDILGEANIAAVHGPLHRSMRSAMMGLVSPPSIRDHLLPKIDEFMRSHLSNWGSGSGSEPSTVDLQHKTKEMALLSTLKQIASIGSGAAFSQGLKSEICNLVLGTLSLPINLPGTSYSHGLKARKKVISMLRELIVERRSSQCLLLPHHDMLCSLLKTEDSTRPKLTDEQIIDMIISLVYSGYETVSTTSMMAVKYLHDHPKVLHTLRDEHMQIRRGKSPNEGIDWDDYKSMKFTRAVILETLRTATVVNGVLRKTTQDIEIQGYIIPKGWKIYVYTREINYDHILYPHPLTFNPWRWLGKNLESHHHFMLFGGGSRLCPGKEIGMVEISTFLHYFVTRYRWEEIGGDKLVKFPRVEAPNGLHIRVFNN